jgi:4-amino-4-deoxy-L-arabinose transferase-like glycosyltransferase
MRLVVGLRSVVLRHPSLAVGLGVFGLALLFRLPDLGASCNVDAVLYWFGRTRKFWAALAEGRFSEMYYSPHPGVSIMWLSGASLNLAGILNSPVTERSVAVATAPLAVLGSAVAAATVPLLHRVLTAKPAMVGSEITSRFGPALDPRNALVIAGLSGALLATEPFLVAHARTFQLDATATGFVWIGTSFGVLALVERRARWALAGGVCLGIAVLTRMLSGTFLVGLGVAFAFASLLERPRTLRFILLGLMLSGATAATAFLLWPALLADPVETLSRVLRATRQTVDSGHVEFSWGKVHERDPGAAFYGGVILMRLTPEVLWLGLLGLALCWRWPKRTLVVLAALAFAYLPPAIGLLESAKKADRYALLFFPFITYVAATAVVDLASRLPFRARLADRAAVVLGCVAAVWFGARALRLASVHPVPIAWCASYPGLRCEKVITLGQGEGFRDAALWIKANSPVKVPRVLSAYAGGAVLSPWLAFRRVKDARKAHFVVAYMASDQRGRDTRTRDAALGEPLHEVRFQNRTYVRVFMGGQHPGAKASRKRANGRSAR